MCIRDSHETVTKAAARSAEHQATSKKLLGEMSKRVDSAIAAGKCGALRSMKNLLGEMKSAEAKETATLSSNAKVVLNGLEKNPLELALDTPGGVMFEKFWKIQGPTLQKQFDEEIKDIVNTEVAAKEAKDFLSKKKRLPKPT
eukprot:TRINITY_DN3082_c0_g1_i1.p1 TRINITY_DN3082_c0_g1~~TRINITY_DN3082_c0_g1_i1.p1  ORF type:complete len:143 (+),score=27.41 TRINITY_DN3082_c0_g1_i1:156-584(+)